MELEDKHYPTEFAYKLDKLMDSYRSPDGDPYNYNEIAKGTEGKVSAAYIRRLHIGEVGNPTVRVLRSLADFFDVAPAYFLEESDESSSSASHVRSPGAQENLGHELRQIATRSGTLDAKDLEVLEDLVAFIRKQQEERERDDGSKEA